LTDAQLLVSGAILLADDGGNTIWRITPAATNQGAAK